MLNQTIDLHYFGLNENHLSMIDERTTVVRKWDWDYSQALMFQRAAVKLLQDHPRMRILICCNHPRVFTNGRGLQRPRKGEVLELEAFRPEDQGKLSFPFHQIERGGGLTFHHPGQFIFYPILKLNPAALSLSKMTHEIFEFSAQILSGWGVQDLSHEHKLMGLWQKEKKLASMGIAIERLTTFHGMALNIYKDDEMMKALAMLNPCGLKSSTYSSVEESISLPQDPIIFFADEFLKRVTHAWQ